MKVKLINTIPVVKRLKPRNKKKIKPISQKRQKDDQKKDKYKAKSAKDNLIMNKKWK